MLEIFGSSTTLYNSKKMDNMDKINSELMTNIIVLDDTIDESKNSRIIDVEDGEIDEDADVPHEAKEQTTPTFEIVFHREDDFHSLGACIIELLQKHLIGKQFEYLVENATSESTRIKAFEKAEAANKIDADENSNDSQDFGVALNNLFTIDPSPSTTLESAKVPSYKRVNKDFLLDNANEAKPKNSEDDPTLCARVSRCFNCDGTGHSLRECPKPRSLKRINRSKKAFQGERYHVDADQRFSHLRPGVISEKLQSALRLQRGQIPTFFYRMRVCGYPPGWLEDAKISKSGLAMFNSGADVLKSEENNSDSEADIKYDVSKLIDFPGFNVSAGKTFYDDYKYHNVPAMSRWQTKEEMINALGDSAFKGYKRRKLKNESTTSETAAGEDVKNIISDPHDMEIEDTATVATENIEYSRPPLPPTNDEIESTKPPPPPPPPTPPTTASTEPTNSPSSSSPQAAVNLPRAESPTLDELQAQQRALLLRLESGEDSLNNETPISPPRQSLAENNDDNCLNIPTISSTTIIEQPLTPLPVNSDFNKIIKSSHIGTPVLKFSPFEKLPSGDNFKVGVSDVINFENLPDSTGKYEMMKDVIKKVRDIKKQLNATDEDDD